MAFKGLNCIMSSVLFLTAFILPVFSSTIATFTDDACKNSYKSLNAENGYPNGTCSVLASQGNFGSFQVVGIDTGCSATIYGKDTDPDTPCSSEALQFAQVAACYNASWVYYSIDGCTPPSEISSSSSSSLASSTPSSTPSASPSPSAASSPSKSNNTGAIAGGVVGGVCGLALIAAIIFLILRRNKKRRSQHPPSDPPEAPSNTLTELPPQDIKPEIYTKEAPPQELGRNSVYIPPAELAGDGIENQKVDGDQYTNAEKH